MVETIWLTPADGTNGYSEVKPRFGSSLTEHSEAPKWPVSHTACKAQSRCDPTMFLTQIPVTTP